MKPLIIWVAQIFPVVVSKRFQIIPPNNDAATIRPPVQDVWSFQSPIHGYIKNVHQSYLEATINHQKAYVWVKIKLLLYLATTWFMVSYMSFIYDSCTILLTLTLPNIWNSRLVVDTGL